MMFAAWRRGLEVACACALDLFACAPTAPPCTVDDLAALERSYQAELAAACLGQGVDCHAKPEIDARYRAKREEWVACRQ